MNTIAIIAYVCITLIMLVHLVGPALIIAAAIRGTVEHVRKQKS